MNNTADSEVISILNNDPDSSRDVASGLRVMCLIPSIPLGGMERAASRVVEKLMMYGADAHFVAEQRWGKEVQKHIQSIGGQWTGIPFVAKLGLPQTLLEWRWAIRSFARTSRDIESVFKNYQPRQLLATNLNNAYFSRNLARVENVRSIFRVPNPPGVSALPVKSVIDKKVWQSVYQSFDVLVCNSEYTAGRVADVVGSHNHICVIKNYLPSLTRNQKKSEMLLSKDKTNIVYLGQISRSKGVEILIDAMVDIIEKRDDVDLILAGPDVWKDIFGSEIREHVDSIGLTSRIRFLGNVENVNALLAQADIHVCPSLSKGESFPNVVLDAKQAGLPSVVFPMAGLPEAVNDGADGIITEACTREALSTALLRLLENHDLCSKLARGASDSLTAYQDEKIMADWVSAFTAE
ncbi:glycosyltransferase family 4 protein [Pseudomonadota bacterium]